ncbi:MAG: M23 family metallopeptidase [Planctomycetes bacterium]|nr:M23 family metallopeptidase [Planctomycetota bacterium]
MDSQEPQPGHGPTPIPQNPPELWVILAGCLLAATLIGHTYIFRGPGGELSLWLYKKGRFAAGLGAWLLGLLALITALRRPPILRRWRIEGFILLMLVIFSAPIPYGYPSPRRNTPSQVEFRLPVTGGPWRVWYGGGGGAHNPLTLETDRCHGWLLVREDDGSHWRQTDYDKMKPEQSLSFGEPVVAPAAGLVVAAVGDEPDRSFQLRDLEATERGNHVVIQVAEGEYLILAHLKQGSLRVAEGDRVEIGQPIGLVGSSGRGVPLTEPHLDIHLANHPDGARGEGIPMQFHGYRSLEGPVPVGIPRGRLDSHGELAGDLIFGEETEVPAPR